MNRQHGLARLGQFYLGINEVTKPGTNSHRILGIYRIRHVPQSEEVWLASANHDAGPAGACPPGQGKIPP